MGAREYHPGRRGSRAAVVAYLGACVLGRLNSLSTDELELRASAVADLAVAAALSLFVLRGHPWTRWLMVGFAVFRGLPLLVTGIPLLAINPIFGGFALLVAAGYLWCAAVLTTSPEVKSFLASRRSTGAPAA